MIYYDCHVWNSGELFDVRLEWFCSLSLFCVLRERRGFYTCYYRLDRSRFVALFVCYYLKATTRVSVSVQSILALCYDI